MAGRRDEPRVGGREGGVSLLCGCRGTCRGGGIVALPEILLQPISTRSSGIRRKSTRSLQCKVKSDREIAVIRSRRIVGSRRLVSPRLQNRAQYY